MGDPRDQTLTSVQSPLSPGEQRDRAVLLVSGNAIAPALSARGRLQVSSATSCMSAVARRGCRYRPTSPCWTTGWCPGNTRASPAPRAATTSKTWGAKNGTFVDNVRIEGRQRLRDGALVFIGNHSRCSGWCRRSSSKRSRPSWSRRWGRWRRRRPRWRSRAIGCDGWRRPRRAVHRRRDRRRQGGLRARRARGQRPQGRFVAINCAAIPRELVESELFGYRAGAHSHRARRRRQA